MTTPVDAARWFAECEQVLLDRVVHAEPQLSGPSLLPDWTRTDVAAHLVGNAQALNNLLTWAATGTPTPMYPSLDFRATQIADYAKQSPAWLRHELGVASAQLTSAFAALTPEQRQFMIKTARGEDRPAGFVAWMRAKEAAVHLVDLDIGVGFAQLPADLLDAIAAERVAGLAGRPDVPPVVLRPTDRAGSWYLGAVDPRDPFDPGAVAAQVIDDATAADLVSWLIGRPPAGGRTRSGWPALPAWM